MSALNELHQQFLCWCNEFSTATCGSERKRVCVESVLCTTSTPIISMVCKHNSHILNIAPDMLRCYTIFFENYELVCLDLCKLCILVWSEQHIQEEGDNQERYNRSYTKCTCCNEHTNLIYNE